jgi:hypothetical protein
MDAGEPRVRRRGSFIHAETPERDHLEYESAEGMPARVAQRKPTHAVRTGFADSTLGTADPGEIAPRLRRSTRSASATDSHRQSRMSR